MNAHTRVLQGDFSDFPVLNDAVCVNVQDGVHVISQGNALWVKPTSVLCRREHSAPGRPKLRIFRNVRWHADRGSLLKLGRDRAGRLWSLVAIVRV